MAPRAALSFLSPIYRSLAMLYTPKSAIQIKTKRNKTKAEILRLKWVSLSKLVDFFNVENENKNCIKISEHKNRYFGNTMVEQQKSGEY